MAFLSVVVRTQGRRPKALAAAIASLRAQTDPDVEVIVVAHDAETVPVVDGPGVRVVEVRGGGRGRPLNAGLDAAAGEYLGFLDDDDLALPEMVAAFRRGAAAAPGAVLRSITLGQPWSADPATGEPLEATGPPEAQFTTHFDLLEHLNHNVTPICSMALPVAGLRAAGLRFDEDLPVLEDWHMLVRAALRFGIAAVDETTAIYRRLDAGNSSALVDPVAWEGVRRTAVDRFEAGLEDGNVVLPPGTLKRISEADFQRGGRPLAVTDLERARERIAQLEQELAALRASRSYRALEPVRRVHARLRRR